MERRGVKGLWAPPAAWTSRVTDMNLHGDGSYSCRPFRRPRPLPEGATRPFPVGVMCRSQRSWWP